MAQLTREDILKLAHLSRLDISEAEVSDYLIELSQILQYVQMLHSVDVDGLLPTHQVNGLSNVTREDVVADYGYEVKDLLTNVPSVQDNQIKVSRMIA